MKKQILLLTGNFPPFSGSGVHRIVKLVKYLDVFDWECHILTMDYSDIIDFSVEKDIPKSTKIYRKKTTPPDEKRNSKKNHLWLAQVIFNRLNRCFIPDKYIFKMLRRVPIAKRIISEKKINVILASSPPLSTLIGGFLLSKIAGSKLILDFRDPWTKNPNLNIGHFRCFIHILLEKIVVSASSVIIANTKELAHVFSREYPKAKIITIPNGFDPDDFHCSISKKCSSNRSLTIIHAGEFYPEIRNPYTLMIAIGQLFEEGRVNSDLLRVNFVGGGELVEEEEFLRIMRQYSLGSIIKVQNYLPHQLVVKEMEKTDVLLLMQNSRKAYLQIPAKAYEYLFLKKPILTLAPTGATANLIKETNSGLVVDPEDVISIKEAIIKLIKFKKNGILSDSFKFSNIEQFHRKALAEKLANVLSGLT